jgi:hypothetical protein
MADVIYSVAVSLDGFVARPDVDPASPASTAGSDRTQPSTFACGRLTGTGVLNHPSRL